MIRSYQDNNIQIEEWKWNTNLTKQWTANDIEAEGAKKISESLKTNTTLISLNLDCDYKI